MEDALDRPRSLPGIRVRGLLRLAPGTVCQGDVHAPAGLDLGDGAVVEGDVYTDGRVELAEGARVAGRVRPATRGGDPPSSTRPAAPAATASPGSDDEAARARLRAQLEAALERAREGDPIPEGGLGAPLDRVTDAYLEQPPEPPWPADLVLGILLERGLGLLAPVAWERAGGGRARVRVGRPEAEAGRPGWPEAAVALVEALAALARPGLTVAGVQAPGADPDAIRLVLDL